MSKAQLYEIFGTPRQKIKKALAIVSSAAIALTAVCGTSSAIAAEETTSTVKTAEFAQESVLFESNYDDVTNYTGYGENKYYVGWNNALAGNTFPRVVEENGFISYTQSTMHLGVIRLGHDYKTKTFDSYNYIEAVPGKTYVIDYDFKIYANTYAQSSEQLLAEGWPKGGGAMEIGVAVANPTASVSEVSLSNYKSGVSDYQVYESYPLLSNPDSNGWIHKTIEYTVPSDIDVSTNNALQIFIGNGSRCEASFDNIKVTSAAEYKGNVLQDESFSGAYTEADKKSKVFTFAASDMYPDYDPDNSANAVMQCIKSTANYSYLYLGADYKEGGRNRVERQQITAQPGDKYSIEFKYKLTKGAGAAEPSFFDLGICTVTSNKSETGLDKWGNNKNYDNAVTFITKDSAAVTDGWQTFKTIYSVPAINNTAVGEAMDKLALFCKIANNYYNIYFDDVSVIKITSEKSVVATDTVIYDTDFSDSTKQTSPVYGDTCGDVYPVTDPLDADRTSAYYRGGSSNNGLIFAGAKLTSNDAVKASAISAKAGVAYEFKFDYYITGTLKTNTDLKLGVCVRSVTGNDYNNTNRYKYSYKKELFSFDKGTEFNMLGYETVTTVVEIPEDTSFAEYGDKLALYMTGQFNVGYGVYIKNVRIKELAPVSVKFVVNGNADYKVFSTANVSYGAASGKSMLWYSDAKKTQSFGFNFYDNGGKLDDVTVYGDEVKSDIPLVKGDVNCDGDFSAEDIASMRKALLGAETVISDYHADTNSDNIVDIRDLVNIKKSMAGTPANYKINGTDVSNYKIIYSEKMSDISPENAYLIESVNEIARLVGVETAPDSAAASDYEIIIGNVNRDGVNRKLSPDSYIVKAIGNKLYVNGGSTNALIAAIKTLEGHIKTDKEINDKYFVDFEYSGGDFSATLALAFSEDFSYDFTGAINNKASPYKSDWTQTYFTDLDNTTTSVKNGSLILKGESYSDENGETAYRGGEVNTKEYYSYGYYEIKAKVNSSTGICPAFWLCGSRDSASKIEYEIDVFECFGNYPDYVKGTLLAHNYPNGSTGGKESTYHKFNYEMLGGERGDLNKSTYTYNKDGWGNEWHTFGLDWKPDCITWYIDGEAVMKSTQSDVENGKYIFDEPMQVRLTCYGGRDVNSPMTGTPDETTDWENGNSLIVDYLKIYQYKY